MQSFVANGQVVADICRALNSAKMRKIANKFGLSLMYLQRGWYRRRGPESTHIRDRAKTARANIQLGELHELSKSDSS